jgi:hypothetical protein
MNDNAQEPSTQAEAKFALHSRNSSLWLPATPVLLSALHPNTTSTYWCCSLLTPPTTSLLELPPLTAHLESLRPLLRTTTCITLLMSWTSSRTQMYSPSTLQERPWLLHSLPSCLPFQAPSPPLPRPKTLSLLTYLRSHPHIRIPSQSSKPVSSHLDIFQLHYHFTAQPLSPSPPPFHSYDSLSYFLPIPLTALPPPPHIPVPTNDQVRTRFQTARLHLTSARLSSSSVTT